MLFQALKLNNASRGKSTAGDMVNLMSVDSQRLLDMCSYINVLWSSPVQIIVALYFLYDVMGISTLAGVVIMVLLIPFNFFVGKTARKLQVGFSAILCCFLFDFQLYILAT